MMHATFSRILTLAQAGSGQPSTDDAGGSFFMPPQASTVAGQTDWIFDVIYWICVFFFVLIVALMVHFCVKYRRRHEGQQAGEAPAHHTPLEVTWTIIPLLLSVAIFYVGLEGYVDLKTPPANAYEVNVTGQKWNWTFQHRNGATDSKVLKVPAGRPVRLVMTSTDVLHSFWIPAFRVKQDVVPGRYSSLWFQADEPGTYQVFCTEYCGTQHSQMVAMVEVLETEDFERQIDEDANWIKDVPDEQLHVAGYRLWSRCGSCHSLDRGVQLTGPTFWETHDVWGEERAMAGGERVVVDENYVRESILYPQEHIVEGYGGVMPSFQGQLKTREVTALVEFIKRLDEVVDETGARLSTG